MRVLLDDRDGRLYASALPNPSSDFSVRSNSRQPPLSRIVLPRPSPSALHFLLFFFFFPRLRSIHNWFLSSACRTFDGFSKVQRSGSDEDSTGAISVSPIPRFSASPSSSWRSHPLPATLFFYQTFRTNPFCALHLLITNDKFVLRLHRRDRTEANSRRRKRALGRDASSLSLSTHSRCSRPGLEK